MTIYKPRHGKLSIGIEIGIITDIINVIFPFLQGLWSPNSNLVMSPNLGTTPTKSHDTSITWLHAE